MGSSPVNIELYWKDDNRFLIHAIGSSVLVLPLALYVGCVTLVERSWSRVNYLLRLPLMRNRRR